MHELFDRCFSNRRDEGGDLIRSILSGAVPASTAAFEMAAAPPRLASWVGESCDRWAYLLKDSPADDARKLPRGHLMIAYELRGPLRSVSATQFLDILRLKTPRHTGWPPFWVPTRPEIEPCPQDVLLNAGSAATAIRETPLTPTFGVYPLKGSRFFYAGIRRTAQMSRSEALPPVPSSTSLCLCGALGKLSYMHRC